MSTVRNPVDELLDLRRRLPAPAVRRATRERHGLSRELVARELGVTQQTIVQWENGTSEPRYRNLEAYVRLLERLGSLEAAEKLVSGPAGRSDSATGESAAGADR